MRQGLKRVAFLIGVFLGLMCCFLLTTFAGENDNEQEFTNTGEINSTYGGYNYLDSSGNMWGAVAKQGEGDNKPAGGDAGSLAGNIVVSEMVKEGKEEYSATVGETRTTPGTSGYSTVTTGPKVSVVEHRTEGTIDITKYSDGSEKVVVTGKDNTVYTKDTFSDGTFVTVREREYTPGSLAYADHGGVLGEPGASSGKADTPSSTGSTPGSGDAGHNGGNSGTNTAAAHSSTPIGPPTLDNVNASALKSGLASYGAGVLLSVADGSIIRPLGAEGHGTGTTSGLSSAGDTNDLRSARIESSDYNNNGTITAHVVKTDAGGIEHTKTIKDSVGRWKDVPKTITLDDGSVVARPQSTAEYLKATVYEPEDRTIKTNGNGSVNYTYKTADGQSHTIQYNKGDGTIQYVSVVDDGSGNKVALVHTFRYTGGSDEDVTSLGYEWAVQNFTDESSPYYGRYVSRTQPIPSASKGGTNKGGLLPVGKGVFQEVFVNYGEHKMEVTHYFNVDVYSIYEDCDDVDCDTIEVYEYSYITKNPPEYYDFHVPLVCLDCVPPAPGVRVCIGDGCDCINTENLVCDNEHSTERYMDIETHTELER